MPLALLLALGLAAAQPPADSAPTSAPTTGPTMAPSTAPATAADLLARARVARLTQDSALRAYQALARERVTARLGVLGDAVPIERTIFREETAARVRWSRAAGVDVELLGQRRFVGVPGPRRRDGLIDAPVPYYPGREALWFGGGQFARADVRDGEGVHPLADGAEAYYTYALGDSLAIRLPDGGAVRLRELRITPREASWRLSVGSFWFDERTAQLVRAAYRATAPIDFWREARRNEDRSARPPRWVPWLVGPARGELRAVTIEHGLYEGRFWLPRVQFADAVAEGGAVRIGVRIEQRFDYDRVDGAGLAPALASADTTPTTAPSPATRALAAWRDSLVDLDSTRTAALRRQLADVRSGRDSLRLWRAQREWRDSSFRTLNRARRADVAAQCAAGAQATRTRTRYGRRLPARVVVPCDAAALAGADVFTTPLLADADTVWGGASTEALRRLLDAPDRQPAWAPQRPTLHGPFGYTRYNRVEGLSLGGAVRQTLGLGYRWEASVRASEADRQLGAEAWLERAGPAGRWRAGAYRRLEQADDYGAAFLFGASLQNLTSGLDEQFYYRAAGAELTGTRPRAPLGGVLTWRAFAERQTDAPARARFTLQRALFGSESAAFDSNVVDTIPARGATLAGAAARWRARAGDDASPWRLATDLRTEVAAGSLAYLRGAADLTLDRALPAGLRLATTASIGGSAGTLPPQRWWNVGGWQTVRGHVAGTRRGDSFWMGRAELRWERPPYLQPVVFADAGWAGARGDFRDSFRRAAALRSAGAGVQFYNGLFRFDAARSLEPGARWRWDSYAVARF